MASKPGILTDWPWKPLGSFKFLILAPWAVQGIYSFIVKEERERDLGNFLILPFLLWRMLHNQIWISLSRYRNAKGSNLLVDKSLEFEQVDREQNWDDQILLSGIVYYLFSSMVQRASHLPIWRIDGVIILILLHVGPVEFLYYWLHRGLHHRYLYSRYHSHHHSSIVTEPMTSVTHPFAEHIAYFMLFTIPSATIIFTGTASLASVFGYVTYIDLMNNMGHCNFEFIPKWLFSIFPQLKYLMYTPSYHSLHHTKFQTNYSLFMPIYDYIYGTMDQSSDALHETSLNKKEEVPHVVHLTHLTTPESIYHLRLGFASFASSPHISKWYMWLMWPMTLLSKILTWIYGRTFVVERHRFNKLSLQTWVIPKYSIQYFLQWHNDSINYLIEQAILEADKKDIKVFSLGLMNQGEELNSYGGLYVQRHPQLKIKIVDGCSLAAAVVLNSIPKGTTQVLLRGKVTKVASAIAFYLCKRGIQENYIMLYSSTRLDFINELRTSCFMRWCGAVVGFMKKVGLFVQPFMNFDFLRKAQGRNSLQLFWDEMGQKQGKLLLLPSNMTSFKVATLHEDEHMNLNKALDKKSESSLILSKTYAQKIWLVGDGLTEEEQLKVQKGTLFIPYSQSPPKKYRKDCMYHFTPAMLISPSLENIYSCENWLPRRVMSAWRIAGIVHALEGWNEHECGFTMSNMQKVWQASLHHGFQPLMLSDESS